MRTKLSALIGALGLVTLAACKGNINVGTGGSGGGQGGGHGAGTPGAKVDKIDILLVVDNSRSMADKQEVLSLALADLVTSLTNPPCVDGTGTPVPNQPPSGLDVCPPGSERVHVPIADMHVGVITTSIGGHGADACPDVETISCPGGATNTTNNDHAHLITRKDPCVAGDVPTYQSKGFLAWDPAAVLQPPGETNVGTLATNLRDMVLGAGQVGCGYESQLESWYRFLVDPEPYQSIMVTGFSAEPQGIDSVLLAQRAAFLRPDSLLAITLLSDEDDCSIKEFGQFFFAGQMRDPNNPGVNFHLPRPRSECALNPADPCCASCGQATPDGCPVDPGCTANPTYSDAEDNVNLRCWEQKRRFGIDFLYPVDRYAQALTTTVVPDRMGNLVPNPLFSDLDPNDNLTTIRDSGLVMFLGIVGVPWQDIAKDPTDLKKGYKTADELNQKNISVAGSMKSTWEVLLGDPASFSAPLNPFMIALPEPRSGVDPITGIAISPIGSPPGANPINGHEYTVGIMGAKDDLQYACIFPLATPRDCADPNNISCDCSQPQNDSPLCEPDPNNGGQRTLQARAKAYPGLRHLQTIRDIGNQGVVASICPAQLNDPTSVDYAYRPAIVSLIDRVRTRLKAP